MPKKAVSAFPSFTHPTAVCALISTISLNFLAVRDRRLSPSNSRGAGF
jgi:hypothetical protein